MLKLPYQADPTKRKTRTPAFPVAGTIKPYGLYPIMIHPVLPGETLQSATMKINHVSQPINYPLGGAWLEQWLIYVKLTDLDEGLGEMFISDDASDTGFVATTNNENYFKRSGQYDWVELCMDKIYQSFFLHDNETPAHTIDTTGVNQVKMNNRSWYENMMFEDADVAVPTTDASDLYKHLQQFTVLQQMGMVEMTYEKYLEQYGSVISNTAANKPEILRFSRSWTLPKNHIEPSDGTPSSAWVWTDEMKADKPKKFTEPGFVIAVQAVRPKLFNTRARSSLIGTMWGFSDWYPIYTLDDPTAGIKTIDTDTTIFDSALRGDVGEKTMIYDHRDLLMQGESFVNDLTNHPYDLPVTTGQKANDASTPEVIRGEYCTESDVNNLFVGVTEASQRIIYDGIVNFTISGHVQQSTPI